jgi:hypothetical protein
MKTMHLEQKHKKSACDPKNLLVDIGQHFGLSQTPNWSTGEQ